MLAEHLVRGGWLLHWYHRTKLHACVALACGAASVVVATALAWVAWLAGTAIIGWAVAAINAFLTFASHAVSNLVPLAMYLARRSSAEHLIATKALRCTATAWMLTVAESLAKF